MIHPWSASMLSPLPRRGGGLAKPFENQVSRLSDPSSTSHLTISRQGRYWPVVGYQVHDALSLAVSSRTFELSINCGDLVRRIESHLKVFQKTIHDAVYPAVDF